MRIANYNNCMAHFPPSRRPDYKTPADSLFLALTHTSSILNSGQITENEISFCCWCQINDIMYTVCAMLCLFLSPLSLSSSLLFTLPPHVFFLPALTNVERFLNVQCSTFNVVNTIVIPLYRYRLRLPDVYS